MKAIAPLLFASGYFFAFVTAQVYPPINPDDYDIDTRNTWCNNQKEACQALCMDQERVGASQNDCDPDTLKYACVCEDGKSPSMTEYSMSLAYQLCYQSMVKCRDNCGGDSACANLCDTGKKCGASNPKKFNGTVTATSAGPSKTSSGSYSSSTGTSTSNKDDFNPGGSMASSLASTGALGVVMAVAAGLGLMALM